MSPVDSGTDPADSRYTQTNRPSWRTYRHRRWYKRYHRPVNCSRRHTRRTRRDRCRSNNDRRYKSSTTAAARVVGPCRPRTTRNACSPNRLGTSPARMTYRSWHLQRPNTYPSRTDCKQRPRASSRRYQVDTPNRSMHPSMTVPNRLDTACMLWRPSHSRRYRRDMR